MRLNSKWKMLGVNVYENENGTRIHTDGLIRFGCDFRLHVNRIQYLRVMQRFGVMGGNRKRGLMLLVEFFEGRIK